MIMTAPWMTGKSRRSTLWTTSWPMPGRVKTVSVTTAPPSSAPSEEPTSVMGGISAVRRAWATTTRRRDADGQRDEQRVKGQQSGRLSALEQRLGHRQIEEDRPAEVEAERAADPAHELEVDRRVEPKLVTKLSDLIGRGLGTEHHRR